MSVTLRVYPIMFIVPPVPATNESSDGKSHGTFKFKYFVVGI